MPKGVKKAEKKAAEKMVAKAIKTNSPSKIRRMPTSPGAFEEYQEMHNAVSWFQSACAPQRTEPRRFPDGFAASTTLKYKEQYNVEIYNDTDGIWDGTYQSLSMFRPWGKGYHVHATSFAAGVVDTYNEDDPSQLGVYESLYALMRCTALGVKLHDYGALLQRGGTLMIAMLPYDAIVDLTTDQLDTYLSQYPGTQVFTSTEAAISSAPKEIFWLPRTFQSSVVPFNTTTLACSALCWHPPGLDATHFDDNVLVIYTYQHGGDASAATDAYRIEIDMHFEAIPFVLSNSIFDPQRAIGSTSAVEKVANMIDMSIGTGVPGTGSVAKSVNKISKRVSGFAKAASDVWDVGKEVWGGIKEAGQFIGDNFGWLGAALSFLDPHTHNAYNIIASGSATGQDVLRLHLEALHGDLAWFLDPLLNPVILSMVKKGDLGGVKEISLVDCFTLANARQRRVLIKNLFRGERVFMTEEKDEILLYRAAVLSQNCKQDVIIAPAGFDERLTTVMGIVSSPRSNSLGIFRDPPNVVDAKKRSYAPTEQKTAI